MSTIINESKLKAACTLLGHTLIDKVDSTKYLCVRIPSGLKWDGLIDSICGRAIKTLGCLRRNLRIGNKKDTAYKTLVSPILEYAAPV